MAEINYTEDRFLEENRFKSISDFKWCMRCGGEVLFDWNDKSYAAFGKLTKTPDSPVQICICQVMIDDPASTELWCDTPDEALKFIIDGRKLRDIITEVTIWERTV